MNITNFEGVGLSKVEEWIKEEGKDNIYKDDLKEILKYANVAFVLEGINRVQSTLICELKASYVQQSQRYVTMKEDSYIIPELKGEDNVKAKELMSKAFLLYDKMSKLKSDEFKGRPKAENYLYGIPIEDARYIVPLAAKTNISVAMSADKLLDLFYLFNDVRYENIFNDVKTAVIDLLPSNLASMLKDLHKENNSKIEQNFYKTEFEKIDSKNNMILLNSFENLDLKVGVGAITSTHGNTPSEVMNLWGEEASKKAQGVTDRVLGYGHSSIAEQARTTFGMMCSMVTYHQQIRHRLSENHREELIDIINDTHREVVVPETVKKSVFYNEFMNVVSEFKNFRLYVAEKYGSGIALSFLLNCDQIKLIISTNARIDVNMLAERICLNAQWEIRELSTKKLNELRKLSKVLYVKALPPCVYGKCKEGKLTCGKQLLMKEKFKNE